MSFENGVPQQSSTGAWAGGLNMSNYSTGDVANLAALNLTGFGQMTTGEIAAGTILRIIDRSTELPDGIQYALDFNIQNSGQYGLGVNAFSTFLTYGEIVTLSRVSGNNPGQASPGMNMSGFSLSTFDGEYVRNRWQAGFQGVQCVTKLNNAANFHGSEYDSTAPFGAWTWQRLRIEDAGGGNKRRRLKIWMGSSTDEPAAWDFDATSGNVIGAPIGGVGWAAEGIGVSTSFASVAYFAFSENPTAVSPPAPSEIGGASAPAEYRANLSWQT